MGTDLGLGQACMIAPLVHQSYVSVYQISRSNVPKITTVIGIFPTSGRGANGGLLFAVLVRQGTDTERRAWPAM